MKNVKLLFTLFSLISLSTISSSNAHIFKVKRWSKAGAQEIVTMHDYHYSFGKENQVGAEQRNDIVDAAKQHNATVIAEDMLISKKRLTENPSKYHTQNVVLSADAVSKVAPTKTPLYGLVSACDHAGIKGINAEFRQAKRASFDGFISAKDAINVSLSVKEEIKNYNDGKEFNSFYKDFLNRYEKEIFNPCKSMLAAAEKKSGTFRDIIDDVPYTVPAQKVFDYLSDYISNPLAPEPDERMAKQAVIDLYDMELLDMRIMHEFAQADKNKPVFICAGYKHIENIEPLLQDLGYKPTQEVVKDEFFMDGMEPTAVDIKLAFGTPVQVDKPSAIKSIDIKAIQQIPTIQPFGNYLVV
ncbi:hypothetical protein Noda2021_08770 [Candidatus Dependentiae bacterium Noda2021]|nr:hypothetical protein Noda2021_08770 [Candidatus Dependentiae bacterium Noda2021]